MTNTDYRECQFCGEEIKQKAVKCKHCQSMLTNEIVSVNNQLMPEKQLQANSLGSEDVERKSKSKAKASLIMGIIGLMLSLLPLLTLILSGLGLMFGIKSQKSAANKLAWAGVVICSIGLFINLIIGTPLFVSVFKGLVIPTLDVLGVITDTNNLKSVADKNFAEIYGDGVVYSGSSDSVVVVIDNNTKPITTLALKAMLKDLGFSSAVADRMYQTRALDGTQLADGKRATATWTFHPNSGLRVVFEKK